MKVGLFRGMCHSFLISRGLQKNSLLSINTFIFKFHLVVILVNHPCISEVAGNKVLNCKTSTL